MNSTLDWVELTFQPEIVVPDDAWAGWDAENQVFLTAGECLYGAADGRFQEHNLLSRMHLLEATKWHDGTPLSRGRFRHGYDHQFRSGNDEASPYYDENLVPDRDQFLSAFKGVRIVSTDPLVIEHWGNNPGLDAERSVYNWWPGDEDTASGYDFGDAAWHNMALMLRGEENGGFAFTTDKADANEIEWTSLIAGPSLEVLATELAAARKKASYPMRRRLASTSAPRRPPRPTPIWLSSARRYGHYYWAPGPTSCRVSSR